MLHTNSSCTLLPLFVNTSNDIFSHLTFFNNINCIYFYRFEFLVTFQELILQSWRTSTQNRPGNYTQNARAKMFLSWQTYEGFNITVHSAIECTKFLLQKGMEFVPTECFCQDPVEETCLHPAPVAHWLNIGLSRGRS